LNRLALRIRPRQAYGVTGYADVTDCGGVAAATWPRLPTETNFSHRICHAAPAPGADASGSLYIVLSVQSVVNICAGLLLLFLAELLEKTA
jgi:hypothetical protein